jgi:hypothetical protein
MAMSWLRSVVLRLRILFGKDHFEREMDEELRFHLEMVVEEKIREGMGRKEARRAALLAFGGEDKTKEECRETRAFYFLDTLWQDLCYGIRLMRRSPGVTAVAVFSLALAIGPNAALFSIVDGLFLRPSPVEKADEIVNIYFRKGERQPEAITYPDFVDLRNASRTVSDLLAFEKRGAFLTIHGQRQLTSLQIVSENYFSMLGAHATLGRVFQTSDANFVGPPPVVISYGLWQRSFGADPEIIGRQILLNGKDVSIVGVAPKQFRGLVAIPPEIWLPFSGLGSLNPGEAKFLQNRRLSAVDVFGRLQPGITVRQAETEFSGLAAQIAAAYPSDHVAKTAAVIPVRDRERQEILLSAIVL